MLAPNFTREYLETRLAPIQHVQQFGLQRYTDPDPFVSQWVLGVHRLLTNFDSNPR